MDRAMRSRFAAIFLSLGVPAMMALSVTPASADGWWLQYSDRSTNLAVQRSVRHVVTPRGRLQDAGR